MNTIPYCEPQLGKRDLYPTLGSQKSSNNFVNTMMWILNLADGTNDLISISEKSKIPIKQLIFVIDRLLENGIIVNEKTNNVLNQKKNWKIPEVSDSDSGEVSDTYFSFLKLGFKLL